MRNILRCENCSRYTMKKICTCHGTAITPKPAKFSVEDKYGKYRRKEKIDDLRKRGLL